MPEIAARSRLSAAARIDLPIAVPASRKATAGATTMVIATATACPGEIRTMPRSNTAFWSMPSWRICGPATMKTTSRSISPMPTVTSDVVTRPRPPSGRSTARWIATASSAVASIAPIVATTRLCP